MAKRQVKPDSFIIVTGNPSDGFLHIGPFATMDAAHRYGMGVDEKSPGPIVEDMYWIIPMEDPEKRWARSEPW